MEFVHRCLFCGWQRDAGSPTILAPHCQRCGCLLASGRQADFAPALETAPRPRRVGPSARAGRWLKIAAFGCALFAAAVTGYDAGGLWVAIGALGASGLAATPLMLRG
jgi:hypothetical protein